MVSFKPAPKAPSITKAQTTPKITETVSHYDKPITLRIPKIHVDAAVQDVGLTADGNMGVPTNIVDVGWYKLGASPGNTGSAVIDGHLDGPHGEPGVFAELNKLSAGDSLQVIDVAKNTARFKVVSTKLYDQSEHPDEVFSTSDSKHLNLITCAGAWDRANKRFAERLVVFAEAVD